MKDEAFCINCGSQLKQTLFPSSILFVCGVCEATDSLSMLTEYCETIIDEEYITFMKLVGENLEWTEINSDSIVTTVLHKNYLAVPIMYLDFRHINKGQF